MHKFPFLLLAFLSFCSHLGAAPSVHNYFEYRDFEIPFEVLEPQRNEVDYLILYVSSDEGKTWKPVCLASPKQKRFAFSAPRDGTYWFDVRMFSLKSDAPLGGPSEHWPLLEVIVRTSKMGKQ
jgi:hypothetical protein